MTKTAVASPDEPNEHEVLTYWQARARLVELGYIED